MKRKLWTLLLALGAALALCVGAGATEQDDFSEALNISSSITLGSNVTYSGLLKVYKDFTIDLTIDLNGYVLDISGGIYVQSGGQLTITDSNSSATHKFSTPNLGGRWVLGESASGTEGEDYQTVTGGVITGGTGKQDPDHPTLSGGGVYVDGGGTFTMSGSSTIIGCAVGTDGGGVYVKGTFTMNGSAAITNCTTDTGITGGRHRWRRMGRGYRHAYNER